LDAVTSPPADTADAAAAAATSHDPSLTHISTAIIIITDIFKVA